ncbi:hypothetical protein HB364_03220 [Pseudoflavitalea sp. X16]|uniref:transglutaminase domain-containing protein n=1 Tax=Paraflavitalea devenefica TaxID=2716334 RepID=UPI001420E439|nr:transglutaminase domain-containing protein [Paraflavitalea devenefica]NII24077.1 hypothetical protein [Paraflavitalea devenefica]
MNGLLLASLFYFYTEKQYENNLFASMAAYVRGLVPTPGLSSFVNTEDSLLTKSVEVVYLLGERRLTVFGPHQVKGIKADFIQPVSIDLMTGQGACGSRAYVLGRLLQEMSIDVRFPQMTVNDQKAGHILVEAKTSYGWVVLDASYNTFFRKQNGQLAGFADVKADWAHYQQQVPADYNMAYRYEDVRYTNWDKIPLVMPLIKNVMYWTMGKEKTDSYSLRSLVLRKFNVLFNITLGAYLLVTLFSLNIFIKARRKVAVTAGVKRFSHDNSTAVPAQQVS